MSGVFALIFNVMMAVQFAMGLLMLVLFFGVGAVLLSDLVVWPLRGRRVRARVVELRPSAGSAGNYRTAIEYTDATGAPRQAVTNVGSNRMRGRVPGDEILAYVRDDKPELCWLPGDGFVQGIGGAIFLGGCVFVAWFEFHTLRGTWPVVLGGGLLVLALVRFFWKNRARIRAAHAGLMQAAMQAAPSSRLRPSSQLAGAGASTAVLGRQDVLLRAAAEVEQARRRAPLAIAVALGLLALSAFLLRDEWALLRVATRAPGQIVRLESSGSIDRARTVHAWVRYEDAAHGVHEFRDAAGSSVPLTHIGDTVEVLYDPAQPGRAMVDHGWGNLGWPALPGGLGLLLLAVSAMPYLRARPSEVL